MKTPRPTPPPSIDRWVEWRAFQREHVGVFPTPQSFDWFLRANHKALAKLGLLGKLGATRRVDAPGLEAFIEKLLLEERAAAQAEAA